MSLRAFRAYLAARLREKRSAESWRVYIADTLRCIAENTARGFGGGWPVLRWTELSEDGKTDGRTAALAVLHRAGIEVK